MLLCEIIKLGDNAIYGSGLGCVLWQFHGDMQMDVKERQKVFEAFSTR